MLEPWEFDGTGDFIVLYGSDLALALSLGRSGDFYDEEELNEELLYSQSLIQNNRIRSLVTPKIANRLIKMNERLPFQRPCTIVVDGSVPVTKGAIFVKCNPLTSATAKLFVKYHCALLNKPIPKNTRIRNLDQLKLLLDGYEIYQDHQIFSVWGSIRLEQIRNPAVKNIYQHLELWARDNIPNDECLKMVYFKVKKELEDYRNR